MWHEMSVYPFIESGMTGFMESASIVQVKIPRRTHDEAKGKPRVLLNDVPGVVAAIIAPAHDALVALDLLAKCVLAAREDQTHCCRSRRLRASKLSSNGAPAVRLLRSVERVRHSERWICCCLVGVVDSTMDVSKIQNPWELCRCKLAAPL